jgi:hypothetical protein
MIGLRILSDQELQRQLDCADLHNDLKSIDDIHQEITRRTNLLKEIQELY